MSFFLWSWIQANENSFDLVTWYIFCPFEHLSEVRVDWSSSSSLSYFFGQLKIQLRRMLSDRCIAIPVNLSG